GTRAARTRARHRTRGPRRRRVAQRVPGYPGLGTPRARQRVHGQRPARLLRPPVPYARTTGAHLPRGRRDAPPRRVASPCRRGDAAARAARRAPVTVRVANGGAGAAGAQAHTQAMAVLQQALRDKARVWVGYVDAHGATASRLVRPISIGAGYLRAEDERTEMLHTFALHRITAAVRDES